MFTTRVSIRIARLLGSSHCVASRLGRIWPAAAKLSLSHRLQMCIAIGAGTSDFWTRGWLRAHST